MEQHQIAPNPFLIAWNHFMYVGAIAMVSIAILVYIFYKIRVSFFKEPKEKYDFINAQEIKWFKRVYFFLGLTAACAVNLYDQQHVTQLDLWFFVRLFLSGVSALLVSYVAALVLEYYYPTRLNYKLRKLRYTPRINAKNGHKMRMLSEAEEDVHLNEGMKAEENIFSIDYDVWVDESTNDIKIEKYQGHLVALQCKNCGFYTMKVQHEEVVERNEDGSPKEIVKYYECSYCKNVRATQFTVSRKEAEDYKLQKPSSRNTKNIDLVKVELHSSLGAKKSFEFNSIDELEKFLKEFDFDKII